MSLSEDKDGPAYENAVPPIPLGLVNSNQQQSVARIFVNVSQVDGEQLEIPFPQHQRASQGQREPIPIQQHFTSIETPPVESSFQQHRTTSQATGVNVPFQQYLTATEAPRVESLLQHYQTPTEEPGIDYTGYVSCFKFTSYI